MARTAIRAGALGELGVAPLVTGVALKVGPLIELGGVDEERDDHHTALLARAADQRQVTLVQRPHRRHEPNRELVAARPGELRAQLWDGAHDPHAQSEVRWWGLIGFGPVPYGYRRDFRCTAALRQVHHGRTR
jgi:hypothetical protein